VSRGAAQHVEESHAVAVVAVVVMVMVMIIMMT